MKRDRYVIGEYLGLPAILDNDEPRAAVWWTAEETDPEGQRQLEESIRGSCEDLNAGRPRYIEWTRLDHARLFARACARARAVFSGEIEGQP